MEEHFLSEYMQGAPEFRPEPWYNPHGDCVVFQMANEAIVADRVDEVLTIYRSACDNRAIGFQIKGVAALIRRLGLEGFMIRSETDECKLISVSALLLAAYEHGPLTINRRMAYASVLDNPPRFGIPTSELIPA